MADSIDLSLDDIIKKKKAAGAKRKFGGQISGRGGKARQFNERNRGGGAPVVTTGRSRGRAAKSGGWRGKLGTPTGTAKARRRGVGVSASARGGRRSGGGALSRIQRKPGSNISPLDRTNASRKRAVQSLQKRKQTGGQQTSVLARGGVLKSGRQLGGGLSLQSRAQKTKRLATLALSSKRRALRMLSEANQQLKQSDVRNTVLARRRAIQLKSRAVLSARGVRRVASSAALTLSQRRRAALARARASPASAALLTRGRRGGAGAAVVTAVSARGRGRRRLDRRRLLSPAGAASVPLVYSGGQFAAPVLVAPGGAPGASLLRVQIKNGPGYQAPILHDPPYDPEESQMVAGLSYLPATTVPPPVGPSSSDHGLPMNRSQLDARIQQDIALIQARGRSQRGPQSGVGALGGFDLAVRPTAACSGRTLNERFTLDRVIYP